MKKILIKGLLALTSLTVILVVLEAGLRISGYSGQVLNVTRLGRDRTRRPLPGVRYLYKAHSPYTQTWPDDPRDYFGSDHSITYRVNNYGFRGEDFDIDRDDRLRIAVIGDSYCWGTGVKEEDRFTVLIEDWLNRNSILGQTYQVYSFCMPGFNTQNEVALYEQVILYFQPDLLLISYFLNDVNLPPDLYFRWRAWEPDSLKGLRRRSRLVDWAVSRVGAIQARPAFVSSVNAAYEPSHPGFGSVVDGFKRLAELNRRRGVPTLLAIFPWLADLDRDSYPFHKAHQSAVQAGREQGFEVLDLFEVFEGREPRELRVHPIDQHPNEVGHRIAAEAIYTRLADLLTRAGNDLLYRAAQRRLTPVPPGLRGPPEKEWYKAFPALSAGEDGGETIVSSSQK